MVNVSVVLCTNRIDNFLYLAIDSLLKQTHQSYEIVLILNGEALPSMALLKKKYRANSVLKIYLSKISYLTHSLNLGIEYSSGKYIARMDADDIADPNRLSVQYKFMEDNPLISVCGSWYTLIDDEDRATKLVELPVEDEAIRRMMYYRNPLCHPTVIFRRDDITRAGGYLGGLHAEDYDLWLRLMSNPETKFHNIPQSLLGYRSLSGGLARGSVSAYAAVSASQWKVFVQTGNLLWFFSSVLSLIKRIRLAF